MRTGAGKWPILEIEGCVAFRFQSNQGCGFTRRLTDSLQVLIPVAFFQGQHFVVLCLVAELEKALGPTGIVMQSLGLAAQVFQGRFVPEQSDRGFRDRDGARQSFLLKEGLFALAQQEPCLDAFFSSILVLFSARLRGPDCDGT